MRSYSTSKCKLTIYSTVGQGVSRKQFGVEFKMSIQVEDDSSSDFAGQNKPSSSVKLPYFHRVLSKEDTELIGDITPKLIGSSNDKAAATSIVTTAAANTTSSSSNGSAWNAANTWEEKDCTQWAKDKLTSLIITDESIGLPSTVPYIIKVRKVSDIQGHAQIAHVRGKARYIYEFSLDLSFTISSTDANKKDKYKATVSVTDIINDLLDDIDIVSLRWGDSKSAPTGAELAACRSAILNPSTVKAYIIGRVNNFEQEFRKL